MSINNTDSVCPVDIDDKYNIYIEFGRAPHQIDGIYFNKIGSGTQSEVYDLNGLVVKHTFISDIPSIPVLDLIKSLPEICRYLKPLQFIKTSDKVDVFFKKYQGSTTKIGSRRRGFVDSTMNWSIRTQIKILHHHGLAYNDLHPENVIDGYLVDFGLLTLINEMPYKRRKEIPKHLTPEEGDLFMLDKYYPTRDDSPTRMNKIYIFLWYHIIMFSLIISFLIVMSRTHPFFIMLLILSVICLVLGSIFPWLFKYDIINLSDRRFSDLEVRNQGLNAKIISYHAFNKTSIVGRIVEYEFNLYNFCCHQPEIKLTDN